MGTPVTLEDRNSPEYLAQLLKDKKQIAALPNVFVHLERLLDEEISKVRVSLFHINTNREPLNLPEPKGPIVPLSEKLYVPVKEYPDFNFVGRILGPRGMTAKQLEQDTGCKIMVRGKGSMRDKKKEEQNRGKPNWEHLNEELHVLITIEDSRNRGEIKLARAVEEVKKLLIPAPEGEDELKKKQLMELAILNGTYRDAKTVLPAHSSTGVILDTSLGQYVEQPTYIDSSGHCRQFSAQKLLPHGLAVSPALRSPTSPALGVGGAPIIMAPRLPVVNTTAAQNLLGNAPPPLVSPAESGLLYNPYEYPYGAAAAAAMAGLASPTLLSEYPGSIEQSAAGAVPKVRRTVAGMREHPYSRVSLA